MKRLLALPLLALGLAGCASDPQIQQEQGYMLEWIGERPLIDYSHLTLTLGDDGRAYGNGGCNHWFARYHLDGRKLSFEHIGSTRRMCAPALMEQEQRFFAALEQVRNWKISKHGEVRLRPEAGEPLRFWPVED